MNAFTGVTPTPKYTQGSQFPMTLTFPNPATTLVAAGTVFNSIQVNSIGVDGTHAVDAGPEGANGNDPYYRDECLTGTLNVVVEPVNGGHITVGTSQQQITLNFPMNFYTSNQRRRSGDIVGCNGGFPPCLPSAPPPPCLPAGSICNSRGTVPGCLSPTEAGTCNHCCLPSSTAECALNPGACTNACTRSQNDYRVCN